MLKGIVITHFCTLSAIKLRTWWEGQSCPKYYQMEVIYIAKLNVYHLPNCSCMYVCVLIIHTNSLQWMHMGGTEVSISCSICKRHLIPFTSHSKTEHVFMYTVAHVPGMEETGEAWGSSLASRENSPCSLLHQLWKGASPAAGHWGTRQECHCSAGCMDPGGQLWEVEKGEWWCAYECVIVSTDWVCSTYTDHANAS